MRQAYLVARNAHPSARSVARAAYSARISLPAYCEAGRPVLRRTCGLGGCWIDTPFAPPCFARRAVGGLAAAASGIPLGASQGQLAGLRARSLSCPAFVACRAGRGGEPRRDAYSVSALRSS